LLSRGIQRSRAIYSLFSFNSRATFAQLATSLNSSGSYHACAKESRAHIFTDADFREWIHGINAFGEYQKLLT
jgi:hypothetical protein